MNTHVNVCKNRRCVCYNKTISSEFMNIQQKNIPGKFTKWMKVVVFFTKLQQGYPLHNLILVYRYLRS